MKTTDELKQLYRAQFVDSGDKINVIAAPGRVTLLGEQISAVPGVTLSAAVGGYIYIAVQRRPDREVNIYAQQYDERITFSLNNMVFDAEHGWANFPKGVLYYLERSGAKLPGFNMVVDADLPEGAGLAASTALCVATAYFCYLLGRAGRQDEALYRLCHTAETKFLKQPVGLLDSLTIGLAEAESLMLYDHADASRQSLKFSSQASLVIAQSSVREARQEPPSAQRLEQAELGREKFSRFSPGVKTLRDLTPEIVDKHRLKVPVPLSRTCRHVASELERIDRACKLLPKDDLVAFGKLLSESHASLSKDFRVSHSELDFLVEAAGTAPGFLRARMFGPGQGGSTLNLVSKERAEDFVIRLKEVYRRRMNMNLKVHTFAVSRGVQEL